MIVIEPSSQNMKLNTKFKIVIILILVVLGVIGFLSQRSNKLGGSDFAYNYYTGVTSATTTVYAAATTTAIYSGNDPAKVEICNTAANPAYLYLIAGPNTTSTLATTTMFVGKGVWLDGAGNTTSTDYACRQFENFKGFIRGVAPADTTVIVNYSR